MQRKKIDKKIKEMETGIGKVKQTNSYKEIIRSIFNQWKNHHSLALRYNNKKKAFNRLLTKHRTIKRQLTEKSKQLQQVKDDFGLVYNKPTGKYVNHKEVRK